VAVHKYIYNKTLRSPEILAPARTPVAAGKNIANTEKKLLPSVKCGPKFTEKLSSERKTPVLKNMNILMYGYIFFIFKATV
jgi:hypothetical protein